MNKDEYFMRMAIWLAKKWYWKTWGNPLVWSIIAKDWKIIWKWYHKKFWWNHAEIEAINSVQNKKDINWSSIYITLEPCNHFWKTPPCTKEILKHWFSKVIIWSKDPNKKASWWTQELQKHGINVLTWILSKECEEINKEFFCIHKEKRCYVTVKIASSIDWCIALKNWNSKWITNENTRKDSRKLRWETDAILVWINTVINDNPLLTTRIKWKLNPIRIVFDSNFRTPLNSNILNKDSKTIIFTTKNNKDKKTNLEKKWHEIIVFSWNKINSRKALEYLYTKWIERIFIEWWPTIITEFLKNWLVNKLIHYTSPIIFWWDAKHMIWNLNLTNLKNWIKLRQIYSKKINDNIRTDYIINYD